MATKAKVTTATEKKAATTATKTAATTTAATATKATTATTKAAEKKPAEKKATAKKATTTKKATTAKKATTTKKAATATTSVFVQFRGNDFELIEAVKTAWADKTGSKVTDIKTIEIYVKPEDGRAYYVINGVSEDDSFVLL